MDAIVNVPTVRVSAARSLVEQRRSVAVLEEVVAKVRITCCCCEEVFLDRDKRVLDTTTFFNELRGNIMVLLVGLIFVFDYDLIGY